MRPAVPYSFLDAKPRVSDRDLPGNFQPFGWTAWVGRIAMQVNAGSARRDSGYCSSEQRSVTQLHAGELNIHAAAAFIGEPQRPAQLTCEARGQL